MNGIKTGKSTSGLIRFSTQIVNNDEEDAMKRVREYISEVFPLLTKYLL